MAPERSLTTLLRVLQTPSTVEEIPRLVQSSAALLTTLINPRNISLVTSHILTAPAIWTPLQIPLGNLPLSIPIAIFSSLRAAILQIHHDEREHRAQKSLPQYSPRTHLKVDDWVTAVVRGLDTQKVSERWKHLLVLAGILAGIDDWEKKIERERHQKDALLSRTYGVGISSSLRETLCTSVVTATNLSLRQFSKSQKLQNGDNDLAEASLAVISAYALDLLPPVYKSQLDADLLLGATTHAMFFSTYGLYNMYFLSSIDRDVVPSRWNPNGISTPKLTWSARSKSFASISALSKSPLIQSLGPLSRLACVAVERAAPGCLSRLSEDLAAFSRSADLSWRRCKLSDVDVAEHGNVFARDTLERQIPVLIDILKPAFFAMILVQRTLLGRVLADRAVSPEQGLRIATSTLRTLRNTAFIAHLLGVQTTPSSQYAFVYMSSLDILSHSPEPEISVFLNEIQPSTLGAIPTHPHDRIKDLFFLTTAEQLVPVLPAELSESLLLTSARPYLSVRIDGSLPSSSLAIFESAHSLVLSVFSAPQNTFLTVNFLGTYLDALFAVFPLGLSARQFRLAIKTLVKVTSPPAEIAVHQPLLASAVLDTVYQRSLSASHELISRPLRDESESEEPLSEHAILVLSMIDALPVLEISELRDWLPIVGRAVVQSQGLGMRRVCTGRFWDVLSAGEMDVPRSALCVEWWHTLGGKELVFGREGESRL